MIKIGTNENVYILGQERTEKGSLSITFAEAGTAKVEKLGAMAGLGDSSDTSGNKAGTTIFLFEPSIEYQGKPVEAEKKVTNLTNFKNMLFHILKRFTTEKNIVWQPFKGLVLADDADLLNKLATDPNVHTKIYDNLVDQFLAMATKFGINDGSKLSRLLLIRQGDKGYGGLRQNFLGQQPFFEDMQVAKTASALWVKAANGTTKYFTPDENGLVPAFTTYEIGKGLDNPIPAASKADSPSNTPAEAAQVEAIFGAPVEEAIDFSAPSANTVPGVVI